MIPRSLAPPALVLAALASGCGRSVPPPAPPVTGEAAAGLVASAATRAGGIRRYQSVVEMRGEGRDGRFSARMLVVFERPPETSDPAAVERLRMELFGAAGGSRWTLVAAPDGVRAVVPRRRAWAEDVSLVAFTGPLLGVEVGAREVAAILAGTGAPLPGGGSGLFWRGERVARAATPQYEVRYADGDAWPPRAFEVLAPELRVAMEIDELRANAALHPDSFRLRIPPGFRRVPVADLVRDVGLEDR